MRSGAGESRFSFCSSSDRCIRAEDYDLDYFDDTELSWEAEDLVIRRADELLDDLAVLVEVRNEARVHLWYGFSDLFAFRTRPNPLLAPREAYEAKTDRWRRERPRLNVIPWA